MPLSPFAAANSVDAFRISGNVDLHQGPPDAFHHFPDVHPLGNIRLAWELIRPLIVSLLDMMPRDQSGTLDVEEIPRPKNRYRRLPGVVTDT